MTSIRRTQSPFVILFAIVAMVLAPVAAPVFAQTPESTNPPIVTEPPVTEPPVTEPPVTEPPVTEPAETEPPATEPPVANPTTPTETNEPTEIPVSDEGSPAADDETSTSTAEVVGPDQLEVVGGITIAIGPGEYRDIVVRYTLGSDRDATEIVAELTAPGGESLSEWELAPWERVDTEDDPADPNRHVKAGIEYTTNTGNGDQFQTTWRVTAPNHIEKPLTVKISFESSIHKSGAESVGVDGENLVTINASASTHNPTLNCEAVVAEDVSNTWNCAFDTTHPNSNVVVNASADVPEGWELALNGAPLSGEVSQVAVNESGAGSFTLAATYPIGCPDASAVVATSPSLSFAYPSEESLNLTTELPLAFEPPTPTLETVAFEFDAFDDAETLVADGRLVVRYSDAPCAWQGSIQFTDLVSDSYTLNDAVLNVTSVEGDPNIAVVMSGDSVVINAPDSVTELAEGELVIHLQLELPHLIPPGVYVIKVVTQINLMDDL